MKAFKEVGRREGRWSGKFLNPQNMAKLTDLEPPVIDEDMRVGARVFRAGSLVDDVLAAAAQAYKDNPLTVIKEEPNKPRTWLQDMYKLTTDYHIKTGKKVPILDLLDAFMVTNMKDIEPGDQALFESRLRERLDNE